MARADLHVHTRYSAWRHLRFVHPRDSYTEPLEVYRSALAAGMDFVAVTDHDSIEGALRLLESPGVDPARIIVGEEVECRFPQGGPTVHVNILGLNEADHAEVQRRTADVRDVVGYGLQRGLTPILNHPFHSFRHQIPLESYLGQVVALFTHVEGVNGGVSDAQNQAVSALCREARQAGRPLAQVGGSDAHTRRGVGRAWTEARGATAGDFLAEIAAGRCLPGGGTLGLMSLAADVQGIIATYYTRLYMGRGDSRTFRSYAWDVAAATLCLPAAFGPFPLAMTALSHLHQRRIASSVLRSLRDGRERWPAPLSQLSPPEEAQ